MQKGWKKAYLNLKEYIDNNPKIKITQKVYSIPPDLREDFFILFDQVRDSFVRENRQSLIDEAEPLASSFQAVRDEAIKNLGLSSLKIKSSLHWFLENPEDALKRLLYNPLFDLLKAKIDIDEFERLSLEKIDSAFPESFRKGYEHWAMFSLINQLNGTRAYRVPSGSAIEEDCSLVGGGEPTTGTIEELVSKPEETSSINLEYFTEPGFVLPDVIVYSSKIDRYLSMRRDLFAPQWMAKNINRKREWIKYRNVGSVNRVDYADNWPDMFMYIDSSPGPLALVVDFSRFCRPDIIIECMEQDNWYQEEEIERIKSNHEQFKPKYGTFIISRHPAPEHVTEMFYPAPADSTPAPEDETSTETQKASDLPSPAAELTDNDKQQPVQQQEVAVAATDIKREIHVLNVGYDQSLLSPVIEVLNPGDNPL